MAGSPDGSNFFPLSISDLYRYVSSIVGFFAILLFVPETKALSLEELDQGRYSAPCIKVSGSFFCRRATVFSVPTRIHATYQIKALPRNIIKYIFRMNVAAPPPLYLHEKLKAESDEAIKQTNEAEV